MRLLRSPRWLNFKLALPQRLHLHYRGDVQTSVSCLQRRRMSGWRSEEAPKQQQDGTRNTNDVTFLTLLPHLPNNFIIPLGILLQLLRKNAVASKFYSSIVTPPRRSYRDICRSLWKLCETFTTRPQPCHKRQGQPPQPAEPQGASRPLYRNPQPLNAPYYHKSSPPPQTNQPP